ncbi:MAG: hypothetical protein GEU86_21700 [Actinophytocola sp.]|nr:hypothetical protein [Actinophytocola sp.]
MTAVLTKPESLTEVTGRSVISEELFSRLIRHLMRDEGIDRGRAERIIDQAVAFVVTSGKYPHAFLRPSKQVDTGWHTMILHTLDYRQFCVNVVGRFVDHIPTEDEGDNNGSKHTERTVAAMQEVGFYVDPELWDGAANCGETGCGAGRPPR